MSELKHKDITEKIIGASFEVHKFLNLLFNYPFHFKSLKIAQDNTDHFFK